MSFVVLECADGVTADRVDARITKPDLTGMAAESGYRYEYIFRAGWQNGQPWLGRVAGGVPVLAALFDAGISLRHTLTILRLLRNTVYGQMLRSITLQGSGARQETAIRLPREHETEILVAMDATGVRTAWGVETAANGFSLVAPGILVEQLLPRVLTLLNEVMDATPVEGLGHVSLTAAHALPPRETNPQRGPGMFNEQYRLSIRWQLRL